VSSGIVQWVSRKRARTVNAWHPTRAGLEPPANGLVVADDPVVSFFGYDPVRGTRIVFDYGGAGTASGE